MQLVEVKRDEIYAESNLVARKFGMKHDKLVHIIENVLSDYPDLMAISNRPKTREKHFTEDRHYRGTDYKVYLMNREFFSLVVMRLKTKKARDWQRKFNGAFYAMEDSIRKSQTNKLDIEWTSNRLIGKTARKEEVDTIKEFVDYATEQGSSSAKFYYATITNCTYKALGLMVQRNPKLRDTMNIYEISQLMLAEKLASNKLKEYMDLGRDYKDIYQSVKEDLIIFADAVRIS